MSKVYKRVIILSVAVGFVASFIPWGRKDGFHGKGFPFFTEAWDKDPVTGQFLDYPSPYSVILNPLLFALVGLLTAYLARLCLRLFRRGNNP